MCEKVKKNRENPEKLADLVCTKGFYLYKRLSKAAKQKKVSYSTSCYLFIYCLELFENWSNAIKCNQIKPNAKVFC